MIRGLLALALVAGCHGNGASDLGAPDAAVADLEVLAGDSDRDGITDADETSLAVVYLPFLSPAPDDDCPTSGLIVRVTPSDLAPLVELRYLWLFDRSCDATTVRDGDGGAFVAVVDPRLPAPDGIISLRGISRPGDFCQRLSSCGRCPGQLSCAALNGTPAVWAGRDRHAIYVDRPISCTQMQPCLVICEDAPTAAMPPIVDVGEPSAPTVHDLTDAGFIRPELGWMSPELAHYDPWGSAPFGSLPPLSTLLTSAELDAPTCANPR